VGQLQTLGIVLALGHEPQLLILDEPVASLDPSARREFLRTLINMVEHPDRTVLFSTHITSDLERVANQIALVRDGRIEFCGDLDTLKERVKRIRVLAHDPLPATFSVGGGIDLEVEGRHASFTTPSYSAALVEELEQTWDAEVSVTDLNLEEIFVELHKDMSQGPDSSQPLVAGGVR
jgi:ABC-2 type transport system ATP-binding protein